jgi:hypothetical protein
MRERVQTLVDTQADLIIHILPCPNWLIRNQVQIILALFRKSSAARTYWPFQVAL